LSPATSPTSIASSCLETPSEECVFGYFPPPLSTSSPSSPSSSSASFRSGIPSISLTVRISSLLMAAATSAAVLLLLHRYLRPPLMRRKQGHKDAEGSTGRLLGGPGRQGGGGGD
jgi:hypothetical protein